MAIFAIDVWKALFKAPSTIWKLVKTKVKKLLSSIQAISIKANSIN